MGYADININQLKIVYVFHLFALVSYALYSDIFQADILYMLFFQADNSKTDFCLITTDIADKYILKLRHFTALRNYGA